MLTILYKFNHTKDDIELNLKYSIALAYMNMFELFPWFIVNCLMLRIFTKYGK